MSRNGHEIVCATEEQRSLMDQLLQLCLHELSVYGDGEDVDADGRCEYKYLDNYWTEAERFPFLIRADDAATGFWRSAIPYDFVESVDVDGITQRFTVAAFESTEQR